jgi:D-alanyl-D-alanine carboxypeptidase/D-alanyl-D-alanine-endopeptidase (penicillin-binding protein 4)
MARNWCLQRIWRSSEKKLAVGAALFVLAAGAGGQHAKNSPAPAGTQRFRARVERILSEERSARDDWGILVADADTGETLYSLNADHFFAPASNAKLVTTALALDTLGPDYRFHTTIESAAAPTSDGQVSGDLFLVGRGDPDLSNRKFPYAGREAREGFPDRALAEMADAAVAKGLREVAGDIVADDSYFPYDPYPAGWTTGDLFFEFGAPIGALTLNENVFRADARPGVRAGDPGTISVEPPAAIETFGYEVTTVPAGAKSEFAVVRQPGPNFMLLRSMIGVGHAPMTVELAMQQPAETAALTLKQLLEARGVRIGGRARVQHGVPPQTTPAGDPVLPPPPQPPAITGRFVLAERTSAPLIESVRIANKVSQNLHAELFLRSVGREALGVGSTAAGLKVEKGLLERAGVPTGDIVLTDGSGLSRDNLVTPRGMVALLRYAARRRWGSDFMSTLPVAGVDGTLEERMRNTPAAGAIRAKTGSVEHVHALSGYATTQGGERVAFAIFSENTMRHGYDSDPVDAIAVAMVEALGAPAAKPAQEKTR